MKKLVLAGVALAFAAAPLRAQLGRDFSVTVAPNYRAFSLDESLAASSASLLLLPVAVYVPIGRSFSLDGYAAYASGSVESTTGTLEIAGPVDTQLRGMWAALPWARLSVAVNLPTGHGTHSTEEAQAAAILSTDLLGFREARFGRGFGVTTGVAAARQLGEWGVGVGASYRLNGEFEPNEDSDLVYAPGDELTARLGLDRNVGAGNRLSLSGTYQHFAEDAIGESNLFRPGARIRVDASYAFRAGRTATMTIYAADLWREQGELSLASGTGAVGSQNVLIVGWGASLDGRFALSPRADVRILSHEDGAGSGWLAGVGTGVETDVGALAVTPRARVMFGSLEAETGESTGVTGFELELAARF